MRMQSFGQRAVNQNDIESLICVWKVFIPFYFAMNKTNYATGIQFFKSCFCIYRHKEINFPLLIN